MPLSLVTYPHPILKTPCKPFSFQDMGPRELFDRAQRMIEIMRESRGIGLAAPQVGWDARVCIVDSGEPYPPYILVNPVIVAEAKETSRALEGCLSLPGVEFSVRRAVWVKVSCTTWEGELWELCLTGRQARIAQHEVDHLDGRLFVSRIENGADRSRAKKLLAKLSKSSNPSTK